MDIASGSLAIAFPPQLSSCHFSPLSDLSSFSPHMLIPFAVSPSSFISYFLLKSLPSSSLCLHYSEAMSLFPLLIIFKMKTLPTIKKRPIQEEEESRGSMMPPAKKRTSAQPANKKAAPVALNKSRRGKKNSQSLHFFSRVTSGSALIISEGAPTSRASPDAPPTPPQDPEIIDLSIEVAAGLTTRPGIDFPRFDDGDIVIELGHPSSRSTYQLHSHILGRASPWFNKTMMQPVKEFDNMIATSFTKRTGIAGRYKMDYNSDLNTLVLAKTVSSR
jgi:hypothetical protein